MAKDDYQVIACKLLTYLYACLKAGVNASAAKAQELAGCNDVYWAAVLDDLADGKLIAVSALHADGRRYVAIEEMRITLAGVEYLESNSAMKKVADVLGPALPALIETAVAATSLVC